MARAGDGTGRCAIAVHPAALMGAAGIKDMKSVIGSTVYHHDRTARIMGENHGVSHLLQACIRIQIYSEKLLQVIDSGLGGC